MLKNRSTKSEASKIDIHQFAQAMGGELLVSFKQGNENKRYQLVSGQCTGIVHYWLCLHLFNPVPRNADFKALEQAKFDAIKNNYGDVMLMQRHYCAPLTATTFEEGAYQSLQEQGIISLTQNDKNASFLQALPQAELCNENSDNARFFLINEIKKGLAQSKYLSFQYNWYDDASIAGVAKKYISQDKRRKHGHRIGIVEHPCPEYEIFFLDANYGVYAFPKKANFFTWLSVYFDVKFRLNAQVKSCASIYPVKLSPQKMPSPFFQLLENTSSSMTSIFQAVKENVNQTASKSREILKNTNF